MKASKKVEEAFNSFTDQQLKEFLQLCIDRKPQESGILDMKNDIIKDTTKKVDQSYSDIQQNYGNGSGGRHGW